ncbi:MAG: DUF1834 family protein, partial [Nitrospinae bacterium]|nr:DUF1834 family protein [Nitrospinota bacterium]
AALNAAPLNAYCKTFERYDGQFDVEDVEKLRGTFPAVFVAYTGDRMVENTPLVTYTVDMGVSVIVAARNLRGDFEAKTDSAGAYQMLEDVKSLLHKNNLAQPDIVGLVLQRRAPLIDTKTLAVFGLDFKLEFID